MRKDIKASCQKRLSRIEGQVRGLSRMVEEDRYCIDIVTQIAAVRAALRRVEEEILRDHVTHCVEHAISSGNKADQRRKMEDTKALRTDTNDAACAPSPHRSSRWGEGRRRLPVWVIF